MSIALAQVQVRTERRIRLTFTGALAGGAYVPGLYALTCTDTNGAAPNVVAALQISGGATNAVELAVDSDLAQGQHYAVVCTNVPGADSSFFTGSAGIYWGPVVTSIPNSESTTDDASVLVFGRDLVFSGVDYVEDATGDLMTVSGLANVQGAVMRRINGYGLPWDPTYGPKLYDYVDGPAPVVRTARGTILQQALADDRVKSCAVDFAQDPTQPNAAYFNIQVTLLDDRKLPSFPHAIQPQTS